MIYDLIIVGAGPAGATFARLIADSGHRILLLDAQTEQNKKPCGGLLAPDAQKALAHFDLVLPKEVLVGPQIFSVKTIDIARGQTRHYSRHYLNIDRYAFDKWLVSLIPPAAEQLCGKCVDIQREGDLFALTVVSGGKTSSLRTRQLVGADGANSIVRQRLFGDAVMHYVAIQQWFRASASGNIVHDRIAKLHEIMVNIYKCCTDSATRYGMAGNLVAGANIGGFEKVCDAMLWQGIAY